MKIKITIILVSFTCMLTVLIACNRNSDNTVTHFADERYELISLILRLTREPFFNPSFSDFYHRLDYTFDRGAHLRHPVISLTRQHISTMNCALLLSIHLQRDGDYFVFIETSNGLGSIGMLDAFGMLEAFNCPEMAERFLFYLNDFYKEINFAAFFRENYSYFAEHSNRLREDALNDINFEWFIQYGLNPANLNVIISHTFLVHGGIAAWRHCEDKGEIIAYAAVAPSHDYSRHLITIVHEFVHAFANYKAYEWLAENSEFYGWVAATYASPYYFGYPCFYVIAGEYLTRAFTALYMQQNTERDVASLFLMDIAQGFRYSQEVFALITDHEFMILLQ